jgi:hypothetical protein
MTLHTGPGCAITTEGNPFSGTVSTQNCDVKAQGQDNNAGCGIKHPSDKSYGAGLNQGGGGVYATQWTDDAISVFFFPRDSIPADALGDSPDPSTWGTPAAKFLSAGCDIKNIFNKQSIVFDTTFCGDWAGNVWSSGSCASKAPTCNDYVRDNPSAFTEAFWTINALRVYQDNPNAPAPQPSQAPVDPTPTPVDPTPTPVDPTPAPVDPTPTPVDPTPIPVDPTPIPVDPTPTPIDPTPAPVDPTPTPIDSTPAPVDPTPAPSEIPLHSHTHHSHTPMVPVIGISGGPAQETPIQTPVFDPSNGGGFAPTPIVGSSAPVDSAAPTIPLEPSLTPAPLPSGSDTFPTAPPSGLPSAPLDSAIPTASLESSLAPTPLPSGSDTFPTVSSSGLPSPSAKPSGGNGGFPGFQWPGKHSAKMSMPLNPAAPTAEPSVGGGFAPTSVDSAVPSEPPSHSALPGETPISAPAFPMPNATVPALPGTAFATGIYSVASAPIQSAPLPSVPATTDAPTAPSDPQEVIVSLTKTVFQTVFVTVVGNPSAPAASAAAEATATPTPAAGGYGQGYSWRHHTHPRHQKQQRKWTARHNARR